jgi:hypothetical protein
MVTVRLAVGFLLLVAGCAVTPGRIAVVPSPVPGWTGPRRPRSGSPVEMAASTPARLAG